MDIFLFGHGAMEGAPTILSEPISRWISDTDVERCIIFTTDTRDVQPLVSEIKALVGTKGMHIDTYPLQPLNTSEANSPGDVQAQPWQVLRELVKQIDDAHDTTLLCGRNNALYDHLLWLVAQCLPKTTLLNIDSAEPPLDPSLEELGGDVSPQTIAGMLSCHLEDLHNGRKDSGNIGFSDAARLSNISGAGQISGINNALTPYITRSMVGRTEVTEGSVTYNLLPEGLGEACKQWMRNRPEVDSHSKSLNIVFGRLPHVSSPNHRGEYASFNPFFDFMSPLQPVDGLLAVIQRHDDEIQDSHVLTLENAIEKFAETKLIGDLKHCKTLLDRRSSLDRFQTGKHLVVINPKANPSFHMKLVMALLAECIDFEREHGKRTWAVDITEPLAPLRSAISFFSFVFKTTTTYIMKDIGKGDEESKLRRRDLALPVPNAMAFSAMSQITQGHGNNKGASNMLIALLLSEIKKTGPPSIDDFDPFDTTVSLAPTLHGLEKKEIQFFVEEELASELQLGPGVIEQFDRTIRDYLLIEQGLIEAWRPPKAANTKTRYSLTFLGTFVAEQLLRIRENEVGN
tara:strand:+ start:1751 stop:3466 length:1716 start_codon:yes stop_codon:yes gene_type:complete